MYKKKFGIPISRQPKIIGITGHFSAEVRELGIQAGMDDVFMKPIQASVVKKILERSFF
jgi:hypothetical protein